MKDKKLEQEFDEYFKGVKTPDHITGDAKRFVEPKKKVMPKFLKFASIAASFVLVFAVAITVILKTDIGKTPSDTPVADGSQQLPNGVPTPPEDNGFKFYTDADLDTQAADAYTASSLHSSLRFIEKFAVASNASVENLKAGYKNGKLALVQADASIINGLSRDETKIFVEFTEDDLIYSGLDGYYDGEKMYYYGVEYYLTKRTAENGEPEFKLHIIYNGVKYYFLVQSSDRKAYQKYLNIIVK